MYIYIQTALNKLQTQLTFFVNIFEYILGENTEQKDLFPVIFCIVGSLLKFTKMQLLQMMNLQPTKNSQ